MTKTTSLTAATAKPRGILPKKMARGVRLASQDPNPIYDQNLEAIPMSSILLFKLQENTLLLFSGVAAWFKRQPAGVKAALVISALWALALLITGCVYCSKKRRGAKVADMVKVQPPSYDEATTVKTKVPLEPLVNEE